MGEFFLNGMQIFNKTKNTILAKRAVIADTFLERMIGLLNRKSLALDEALIITACQSIHTFFMRFSIDVIFIDKAQRVVGIIEGIKPFRLSPVFWKACWAVEVHSGTIASSKTSVGDLLL